MNPSENYILSQSEPFRSILLHLQTIIELTVPDVDLKYKYKIPFYYVNGKPFVYMNQSKNYVDLGFYQGQFLSVHLKELNSKGRKMIKSLRYTTLEEIDNHVLIDVLNDAFLLNEKK